MRKYIEKQIAKYEELIRDRYTPKCFRREYYDGIINGFRIVLKYMELEEKKGSQGESMRIMDLNKAVICDAKKPSEHCKTRCVHGIPHMPIENLRGSCNISKDHCNLMDGRAGQVVCRKLTKKEIDHFKGK